MFPLREARLPITQKAIIMAKKTCPNGHVYDPSIYGDQCPLCPASVSHPSGPETNIGGAPQNQGYAPVGDGMHTQIGGGSPMGAAPHNPTMVSGAGMSAGMPGAMPGAEGPTVVRPKDAEPVGGPTPPPFGKTVIRRPGAAKGPAGDKAPQRKLVGFLVSNDRRPFMIYEGKNYIGRDESCGISVPDDNQMSSTHLSILYRAADTKFKFRDEQSSNGTFINGELLDDGELKNYDVIRAGNTLFVFMAIPDIF